MAYWVLKVILSPIFFIFWRIKVEREGEHPKKGPAVLAANHQSFCDSFFIPLVVARKVTYLAKAEYFDSKKTAWFFRAAGQIPIRRGGGSPSERGVEMALTEVLDKGRHPGPLPQGDTHARPVCPQGPDRRDPPLTRCGVPIIPVGVVGTVEVQPVNSRIMRPFSPRDHPVRQAHGDATPPVNPDDPLEGHDHNDCRAFTNSPHAGDRPPLRALVRGRVRAGPHGRHIGLTCGTVLWSSLWSTARLRGGHRPETACLH